MWPECREATSSVSLMNVMRRILEHYFLQLSGYDGVDLRTRILKDNRDKFVRTNEDSSEDFSSYYQASAIVAYVSQSLTGISDDIHFVTDAQNPDQMRSTSKQIFELMGQGQHYAMMSDKQPMGSPNSWASTLQRIMKMCSRSRSPSSDA
ncbi:hypothetical protein [Arcanobacterium phocae]|uniref:hypothetical protein n=1 Tax=Arcanobacterium phocae TaxID=131112 RepID=UPI001C0EF878|nr:hypothetical protein [Arcanobacterium phocae]